MKFDLLHPADQIVMIMERIYTHGMTTTSGGNLSVKDDNGDIWISPAGVDKGSLTAKDIVCVKADGTVEGIHRPSSEFPFHKSIYEKRPDLKAVLHAHPPALVAFSIVRRIPSSDLLPDIREVCGSMEMAEYGLPGSLDLGEKIAQKFLKGINTVLLENHGVVVGADDLFNAFMSFETLDFCARLEIAANRMGPVQLLNQTQLALTAQKRHFFPETFTPGVVSSAERIARRKMVELIHRAYKQRLISSTQGTFSRRLDGGDFIITPFNLDRKYLQAEDLVRIEDGKCEVGKSPSRSMRLHQRIYERHPEINSIIIAHPPSMMVFAVTDVPFDSRTIPESYILLRTIKKLDFGGNFLDIDGVVDELSSKTPIVMMANDCFIVTGDTLLSTFDRLEVAEYSAKAIISARSLGEIVSINDHQISELEIAFHLVD
ncbi:MAG: class II aldolase/adducin family protein [Rhodoferax sp.]|uniref:class II aldolase/adducin family protein n=1 Tax=Rhodoferax sp. TaxID=50421 RepID=UPI0027302205|nr:class II aldolase/adducin family protein [Rhodoferax sp.]MDP1531168.1 class II aldolase/adducin family protein [Rhodoferax sp.]MDP1942218.1 class II aldolase/adducin family protein [Rhodoferax sp.]